jgi:hypothetical protein
LKSEDFLTSIINSKKGKKKRKKRGSVATLCHAGKGFSVDEATNVKNIRIGDPRIPKMNAEFIWRQSIISGTADIPHTVKRFSMVDVGQVKPEGDF